MRRTLKVTYDTIRGSIRHMTRRDASLLAAGLAFFAMISLAPFIVLAIAIAGAVFGADEARHELAQRIQEQLGPKVAEVVKAIADSATDMSSLSVASIVGLVLLVWSSSKLFVEIRRALHAMWEIAPPAEGVRGAVLAYLRGRLFAALGTLIFGGLLLALTGSRVVLHVIFHAAKSWGLLGLADFVVSLGLATVLVALVFRLLPDRSPSRRAIWAGAFATAIMLVIGRWLVGWYVSAGAIDSAYGAAGSVVVFLVSAYWSSLAFLFGARLAHDMEQQWRRATPMVINAAG